MVGNPTPPRKWRPGSQRGAALRRTAMARLGDNRFMWLKTGIGQFIAYRYEKSKAQLEAEAEVGEDLEAAPDDPEYGPSYVLVLPRGRGTMKYNFTSMTEEELNLTRQFFNELFDLAEPIIKHRDKVAKDAAEAGDDTYVRNYRQAPQFIVRKGTLRDDDQRILERSQDLPEGSGTGADSSDGRVRGAGDELAPEEPMAGQAEDDSPSVD